MTRTFVPFLEVVHSLGRHIAFFCAVYQLSGAIVGDCAGIRCYKFGTEQGDVEPYAVTARSS